jgi:hypothetical protein
MSVARKLRRLGEMSLEEIRFRASHWFHIQAEKMTLGGDGRARPWNHIWTSDGPSSPDELPDYLSRLTDCSGHRWFCSPIDRESVCQSYAQHFPERIAAVRKEADAICEHRFRVFAYPEVRFGREIPWRLDFVHHKQSGLEHWSRFTALDFEQFGDTKIVWELNRHQHFLTLGRAFVVSRDETYAEECLTQLEDWRAQNPYLRGINWASSLEVAFRAWSWLWALHFISGSRALTSARLAAWIQSLGEHADYIAQNLSTYSSPNTHLLGEGFGLYAIGMLWPELRGAAHWRATGRRILEEEMLHQVRPDGSHLEQSTYYHRYAADFFLCAAILADKNGCSFPALFRERLERMCDFILHTQLPGGLHPMIGDADGGRLLALTPNHSPAGPNDQRATLCTAAVYFSRGDFCAAAGRFHEETFWLLGRGAAGKFAALEPVPRGGSRVFPDAGLVIQRSGEGANERMLLFDAGPQGMGPCGHGHADALQVQVSADGVDWLVDPGTFVYTSSRQWRDFFRGTRAHNTLCLDGADQAVPVDFFKWTRIPAPKLELAHSTPCFDVAIGAFKSFEDVPEKTARIRRSVVFVKPDYFVISDFVEAPGWPGLDAFFHFAPGIQVSAQGESIVAIRGESRFLIVPPEGMQIALRQGEMSPCQGWHSEDYGQRVPAPVLCASKHMDTGTEQFVWLLAPNANETFRLSVLPGPGLRLSIAYNGGIDLIVIRGQEPMQTDRELWTDAEVVFVRRSASGQVERFAMCNGCCASLAGQSLLRVDSMLNLLNVVREGHWLKIDSQPQLEFDFFAPGASTADYCGKKIELMRSGDWVRVKS